MIGLRRIFFQIGLLAGLLAFGLTIWLSLGRGNLDFLQASYRAVIAGIVVLVLTLLLFTVVKRMAGPR
jgi:hypothetical protein